MMLLKKGQMPIVIVNIIAVLIFTFIFLSHNNYEFLIYIGVIVFFFLLIILTNHRVNYPNLVLWALTVWSILHMSGGGIYINGKKLYELILIPLVGAPYYILKYDQFVHAVGFGVATLAIYYLLKPLLKNNGNGIKKWTALSVVVVMAGLGAGALNEIVEFVVTVLASQTGVGGYVNNSLDLVFNLIGAIIAMIFIRAIEKKKYDKI